jgi:transcriptional regulator with XRE-family HTH domain
MGLFLKSARRQLSDLTGMKYTQKDLADASGCSETMISRCEKNIKVINDIRPLYKIADALEVPMYVLIRNELGISDEEMQSVIKLPKDNSKSKVKISIPNDDIADQRIRILDTISTLSQEDLETLSKFLPAFQK